MDQKQKILVCGDVEGKFKTLFSRVSAINEKNGPFDFLLCVGDFFGESPSTWEMYRNGSLKVEVPTYILGPVREKHISYYSDINGCEMCPNVNYLGKRGILTSGGLKIAYVSGRESKRADECSFTEKDISDVRNIAYKSREMSEFLGVDVLLSSEWPKGVTNLDENKNVPDLSNEGSEKLSWLACQLRPRYHFAGLHDAFYERPPYANFNLSDSSNAHCTRFIALAKVGNPNKSKWLYAASLTPIDKMKKTELYQMTCDQTKCPYPREMLKVSTDSGKQFFYDMDARDDTNNSKRKGRSSAGPEKKRMNFDDPECCWFCLASTKVEKHLVVSIGEEVYLAIAKGGLTPRHVMILPIEHHQSLTRASDEIKEEMKKFKSALRKMFKKTDEVPIFFERNYKTCHLQLQVVPVPKSLANDVKNVFMSAAEEYQLEMHEVPDHAKLEDIAKPGSPYFYVELPTKEKLFCSCKKNFPLQFGRDVLASEQILDIPEKVDWKDCVLSKTEEQSVAEDFRKEFEEFDPTS